MLPSDYTKQLLTGQHWLPSCRFVKGPMPSRQSNISGSGGAGEISDQQNPTHPTQHA